MGRKKHKEEAEAKPERKESPPRKERDPYDSSDDSDVYVEERRNHPIDPEIQQLAITFGIDAGLTQQLNDIMIEDRSRTWEADLARLYEILKDARSPGAMLTLKIRDMEKGKFVGKAKCTPKVKELAKKHRLDHGASTKLEEAMSMREAMGKDVDKDLMLLDEHLQASNKPSALVSQKLDTLRKGYNIGHSIYSREVMPGGSGPGVDGVFDKKSKRAVGYSDAELDRRFGEQVASGGGQLMDEATVRKIMMAERKQHEAAQLGNEDEDEGKRKKKKDKKRSRSRSRKRSLSRSPDRSRSHKKKKSRSRSQKRKRSRSRSQKRRQSPTPKRRRSPSVKRKRSRS